MILSEYYRQEFGFSVVESFHTVGVARIEIQGIARIQLQFMVVDDNFQSSFQDVIEFLSGVTVAAHLRIGLIGLHGHQERFGLFVAEIVCQVPVVILLSPVEGHTRPVPDKGIDMQTRAFTGQKVGQFNPEPVCDLKEEVDGNIRFTAFVFLVRIPGDAELMGERFQGNPRYLPQLSDAHGNISDVFRHPLHLRGKILCLTAETVTGPDCSVLLVRHFTVKKQSEIHLEEQPHH
jgi:hypothetical protein